MVRYLDWTVNSDSSTIDTGRKSNETAHHLVFVGLFSVLPKWYIEESRMTGILLLAAYRAFPESILRGLVFFFVVFVLHTGFVLLYLRPTVQKYQDRCGRLSGISVKAVTVCFADAL